jgi:hypothetical protein
MDGKMCSGTVCLRSGSETVARTRRCLSYHRLHGGYADAHGVWFILPYHAPRAFAVGVYGLWSKDVLLGLRTLVVRQDGWHNNNMQHLRWKKAIVHIWCLFSGLFSQR